MMPALPDPLKIYYFVVLHTERPKDTTVFQGFSVSWRYLDWALYRLATLPADVLERSYNIDDVIAHRMGNLRPVLWFPISVDALEKLAAHDIGPFFVCFSGEQEVAARVSAWAKVQPHPVLHVSTVKDAAACSPDDFTDDRLRAHCIDVLEKCADELSAQRQEAARAALKNWRAHAPIPAGIKEHGHNITLPNHMSLLRATRSMEEAGSFMGDSEAEYTNVILDSIKAVFVVREQIGVQPLHFMTLLTPPLILAEPAFYRHAYARIKPEGPFADRVVAKALRTLQAQKTLWNDAPEEFIKELRESPQARGLIAERRHELDTLTLGVGLKAAQTCSAVMRLSPAVNHVFPALAVYANNIRSTRIEARLKTRRLFEKIQADLRTAVGEERIAFITEHGGPLKIVSDAPVEWIPFGNLPLSMRFDCSRINATPGNLLMGQLTNSPLLTFEPAQLRKILIISSFTDDDPLKNVLTGGLDATRDQWEGKADLVFRVVKNQNEFIEVLNAFDGYIMIFDGHGADNADEPVGKIVLSGDKIDVWALKGRVRIPPIVILSACDTHGIDASSHATVGNGFLALDARTVLATLLPVDGYVSSLFIARLVYRIAEFLPVALKAHKRVLNWTEVIAGMLRMLLASEMLDHLVGPPAPVDSPRGSMQSATNMDINTGDDAWYDHLIERIAAHRGETRERVESRATGVLARSEAIRYVQLGNPETILIDDGTIHDNVMKAYGHEESV